MTNTISINTDQHPEGDEDQRYTWVKVERHDAQPAAFTRDPSGVDVETVDFDEYGQPDWTNAAEVEPHVAENPGLCAYVRELLDAEPQPR